MSCPRLSFLKINVVFGAKVMFQGVGKKFSSFRADRKGIVLYLVALLIVPFVVLAGVAVDFGQLLIVKNQLSSAIDAAALDIGASPGLTQAQAQAQAQAFVNANFSSQYSQATLSSLNVIIPQSNGGGSCPANTVCVTASASINTVFIRILGSSYNTLSTAVSTQVTVAQSNLEVVLVLDNTGSMEQVYGSMTGIAGLRLAATTLVNTLFASDPTGQHTKVGIVPFTDTVNVGTQYANASWIDNSNAAGSMSQENISVPTGTGLITFAQNLSAATGNASLAWGGCVRQRTEIVNGQTVNYDIQDIAPTVGAPETLFTPYFAPDEPDGGPHCVQGSTFINSYLCDRSCWQSSQPADQMCTEKYTGATGRSDKQSGSGVLQTGSNFLCTAQPVIRLSTNQTDIINEINAMTAGGATVVPAGLMWGWHLLSPNGPFADGVAYTDSSTVKVIIVLTDGDNDVQDQQPPVAATNGFNQSVYNAYGYGSGPHLNILPGPTDGSLDQADYNIDQKEIALCNNIKAVQDANGNPNRIQIYAIGFGTVITDRGLQLLQQCATSASTYFYNPTSDELVATFQSIAVGLNQLRISK